MNAGLFSICKIKLHQHYIQICLAHFVNQMPGARVRLWPFGSNKIFANFLWSDQKKKKASQQKEREAFGTNFIRFDIEMREAVTSNLESALHSHSLQAGYQTDRRSI